MSVPSRSVCSAVSRSPSPPLLLLVTSVSVHLSKFGPKLYNLVSSSSSPSSSSFSSAAFFLSPHIEHSCGTRRMGRARAGVKNAVIEKWAQRLGVCSSDRPRPTDRLSDLTRTRYDTDIAFPSFVSCLLLASEGVYSAASRRGMPSIWGNKLCVGPRIGGNCLRVLTIPRPTLSGLSLSQSPIRLS